MLTFRFQYETINLLKLIKIMNNGKKSSIVTNPRYYCIKYLFVSNLIRFHGCKNLDNSPPDIISWT